MDKSFRTSGLFFLFCGVINVPLIAVLKLFSSCLSSEALYITASILPVIIELAVLFSLLKKYNAFYLWGLTRTNLRNIVLTVILIFLIYPFLLFTARLSNFLVPESTLSLSESSISVLYNIGPVIGFLILSATPAVAEELIYRGYIFGVLRKRSFICAVTVSSFSFAIMHGNLEQTIYNAILGIMLCLTREITGSILPCIIAHMLFNSVFVYSLYTKPRYNGIQASAEALPNLHTVDFINFWLINSRLFIISMTALIFAVIIYALLKNCNNSVFDFTSHKNYPIITSGYIIGWIFIIFTNFI